MLVEKNQRKSKGFLVVDEPVIKMRRNDIVALLVVVCRVRMNGTAHDRSSLALFACILYYVVEAVIIVP